MWGVSFVGDCLIFLKNRVFSLHKADAITKILVLYSTCFSAWHFVFFFPTEKLKNCSDISVFGLLTPPASLTSMPRSQLETVPSTPR